MRFFFGALILVCSIWCTFAALDTAELDIQYAEWLKNYKSPKPRHQHYCSTLLQGIREKGAAQFGQDMFMFFNFFKYWPMQGKKGFYVDSGANDAMKLSNSFFFDVCLGWEGLCVEPLELYHRGIKETRSCVLVTECISDIVETRVYLHGKTGSRIQNKGEDNPGIERSSVNCLPLRDMLKRSSDPNRNSIDFWSLDVEGHEIAVIQGTNFKEVDVHTMLIENSHINQCILNPLMQSKGFYKYQQLIVDAVYAKNGSTVINHEKGKMWFHDHFHKEFAKERFLDVQRSKTDPAIFPPENHLPCAQ
jgi:hypothetical protein